MNTPNIVPGKLVYIRGDRECDKDDHILFSSWLSVIFLTFESRDYFVVRYPASWMHMYILYECMFA